MREALLPPAFCPRGWLFERLAPRNPAEILSLPSLPMTAPNLPFSDADLGPTAGRFTFAFCRPELPCPNQLDGSSACCSPGAAPSTPTRSSRPNLPVRPGRAPRAIRRSPPARPRMPSSFQPNRPDDGPWKSFSDVTKGAEVRTGIFTLYLKRDKAYLALTPASSTGTTCWSPSSPAASVSSAWTAAPRSARTWSASIAPAIASSSRW